MAKSTDPRTTSYLVKLTPAEKKDLGNRAKAAGFTLADAFRQGADLLLSESQAQFRSNLASHSHLAADAQPEEPADPLAAELYALARKVDRRISRG